MARVWIMAGMLGLAGFADPGLTASPPSAHFAVSATIVARCTASTPSVIPGITSGTTAGYVSVDCGGSSAMQGSQSGTASGSTAPSRISVDESGTLLLVTVEF